MPSIDVVLPYRETMAANLQFFWGLFLALSLHSIIHSAPSPHVYIVYLGLNHIHDPTLTSNFHHQLLSSVFGSEEDAKRSMLYSYKHSFSGFSAKLNSTQATALAKMEGVISVFRSKTHKLHTTRSWDFLGLTLDRSTQVIPLQLGFGDDVIVGVIDSGIWPESKSFQEEPGMRPIPLTWKGRCEKGEKFDPETKCNRKLIGARYFLEGFEAEHESLNMSGNAEYRSPRDFIGHGTHTASTAVGSTVKNVNFFGFGQGTARGGAPRARLAVYKACWGKNFVPVCSEADIMAAFDYALHDGVHVISASIGLDPPLSPFFASMAGIGSFHAMQLGITVVFSAGNAGPDPSLVTNVAPWSISVAASSVDRTFPTQILGDNNFSVMGESFITTEINAKLVEATAYFNDGFCVPNNTIKNVIIKPGRIILCFSTYGPSSSLAAAAGAKSINASALIFVGPMTRRNPDVVDPVLPTVLVNYEQGTKIRDYLSQFRNFPPLQIKPAKTKIGKSIPAPIVADFSSRGPSSISPDILKPDVSAPGVNILAAWPHDTPPSLSTTDGRRVKWNFQSGTSMSCPHVSGVVALIKSAHPSWSPSAIRSALMTTADTGDTTFDGILAGGSMKLADPFDIGAGHINPLKALDPGLVYEMKTSDYILFLCNVGYTQANIQKMVLPFPGLDTSCSRVQRSSANVNYPSISVSNLQSTMTIRRTVRNVGHNKNSIYFARVAEPDGVEVSIWPKVIFFSWFQDENTYYVTLKPLKKSQGRYDFGEIVWSDGFHRVRSPLVVRVNTVADSIDSTADTGTIK